MTCTSDRPERVEVLVIGGGAAGLTAAFELTRRGRRPLVLEAASRPGGAVARHLVAGIALDAGAESFATSRPAVSELIGVLGIGAQVVHPAAAGAWVFHESGTAPLPQRALLGIPGRALARDVRAVLGVTGSLRALADRWLPKRCGRSGDPSSLGRLVRSRMGARVLRRLVEPVVGGVYATDPSELDIDSAAPGLTATLDRTGSLSAAVRELRGATGAAGSAVAGLRGGMAELISALTSAVQVSGEIRTGAAVSMLQPNETGWLATTSAGTIHADAVFLAVPAAAAASLLRPLVPAEALTVTATTSTPVLLCTLVLDDARLDTAPRGSGVLVAGRAIGVRAKALTHATAKWPWLAGSLPAHRHVLRLSYGRAGQALPDPSELPELAVRDASTLLGVPLRATDLVDHAVVRWDTALPQSRPGHAAAVAALRTATAALPGLAVAGAYLSGTGLAAVVADTRSAAADLHSRMAMRTDEEGCRS